MNHKIVLDELRFDDVGEAITIFGQYSIIVEYSDKNEMFGIYFRPSEYSLNGKFGLESSEENAKFLANMHYKRLCEPYMNLFKIERTQ